MGEMITEDVLDAFAVVAPPSQVASGLLGRFGGAVDRISFYAPYKLADGQWDEVLAGLRG